ncbi:hypothetical protein M405DRAFT_831639 [Rhizopogon salebrosus TDB-379]|nr:hypothetical protein M405DRAFT_831639 [Rhizopogon salebrosus TDB-379]
MSAFLSRKLHTQRPSLLPKSSAAYKCLSSKDIRKNWSDEGYVCMKRGFSNAETSKTSRSQLEIF